MTLPLDTARAVLVIDVTGQPITQGSKRIGRTKAGKPIILDVEDRALKTWRGNIAAAAGAVARLQSWEMFEDVAVAVRIDFYLPRPKSVTKRRRPNVKPDADKLARACLDALTGIAYRDDSRVVDLHVRKFYAVATPGARITVEAL